MNQLEWIALNGRAQIGKAATFLGGMAGWSLGVAPIGGRNHQRAERQTCASNEQPAGQKISPTR